MANNANNVLNGIMGLCIADAVGVPVEFIDRETLSQNPVVDMRSFGSHHKPAGTWSDDSSLTLCLADSLTNGLDYDGIMKNFMRWINDGEFTPYGEAFGIGNITGKALDRYSRGTKPLECGGLSEEDNGNGSLMRILPIVFYLQAKYGTEITRYDEAMAIIHNVSSLTHAHKRSIIACGIYCAIACRLMGNLGISTAIEFGISDAKKFYKNHNEFAEELKNYKRLGTKSFAKAPCKKIKSSGYVVDTLEAALWCLLNTDNYKDCVLMAVNLGGDTDTVAAVAGGLAGLHYGYDNIPEDWLATIVKRDEIENLCERLNSALNRMSIEKLCSYIPYFETATEDSVYIAEVKGERSFPRAYPVYENTLRAFIKDFYNTKLVSFDYIDVIERRGISSEKQMIDALDTADLELVRAILTYFVRQERFCDGLWASAVEEKAFLKGLKRLQKLMELDLIDQCISGLEL